MQFLLILTRIIPALAGNTIFRIFRILAVRDHPRSRGEYDVAGDLPEVDGGSSPLSRGIPVAVRCCSRSLRIIPALAGNTPNRNLTASLATDHPRSRGEYVVIPMKLTFHYGSSPLSRGILGRWLNPVAPVRIIPALAGNTRDYLTTPEGLEDHPRSRGEYHQTSSCVRTDHGSSPLSRGIPVLLVAGPCADGIIPALAGNTLVRRGGHSRSSDHPRSRGEYLLTKQSIGLWLGSSPLSRGIPIFAAKFCNTDRIIPALAGNTTSTHI